MAEKLTDKPEIREVMDLRQAAEYLRISPETLYAYLGQTPELPAFKLGNRWRFKKSLLDLWLEKQSIRRTNA